MLGNLFRSKSIEEDEDLDDFGPELVSDREHWYSMFGLAALIGYPAMVAAMRFLAPYVAGIDASAKWVLAPVWHVYFGVAVLPAIALAATVAHLSTHLRHRAGGTEAGRLPNTRLAVWTLVLLVSLLPYYFIARSSVQFKPEEVTVAPAFTLDWASYSYSDIKQVRASIQRRNILITQPWDAFVFALDFNDGRTWKSAWYPYQADGQSDARLMRFLRDKTGRHPAPTPVL